MKISERLKVSARLYIGFGSTLLMALIMGGISIYSMHSVKSTSNIMLKKKRHSRLSR